MLLVLLAVSAKSLCKMPVKKVHKRVGALESQLPIALSCIPAPQGATVLTPRAVGRYSDDTNSCMPENTRVVVGPPNGHTTLRLVPAQASTVKLVSGGMSSGNNGNGTVILSGDPNMRGTIGNSEPLQKAISCAPVQTVVRGSPLSVSGSTLQVPSSSITQVVSGNVSQAPYGNIAQVLSGSQPGMVSGDSLQSGNSGVKQTLIAAAPSEISKAICKISASSPFFDMKDRLGPLLGGDKLQVTQTKGASRSDLQSLAGEYPDFAKNMCHLIKDSKITSMNKLFDASATAVICYLPAPAVVQHVADILRLYETLRLMLSNTFMNINTLVCRMKTYAHESAIRVKALMGQLQNACVKVKKTSMPSIQASYMAEMSRLQSDIGTNVENMKRYAEYVCQLECGLANYLYTAALDKEEECE